MTIRVLLFGASGRMGKACIAAIQRTEDIQLAAGIVSPKSSHKGVDLGELAGLKPLQVEATDTPPADGWDLIVDFSLPEGAAQSTRLALEHAKPLVSGVTGLSEAQLQQLKKSAAQTPVLFAPNFAPGIALMVRTGRVMHRLADRAGTALEVDISEIHHAGKLDRPSGTALALAEATGLNGQLVRSQRTDEIGDECEHRVRLQLQGERLELTHRAPRRCFAEGALQAARWLHRKPPGFYGMQDVISDSLE